MNSEIFIRECSEHQLETIAIDMNPNVDTSCRHCCIKCLKDPLKAQHCLPYNEARTNLDQVKKTFKLQKEAQIKNNISTLMELDKNVIELKDMQVKVFDEIQETINRQIQLFKDMYSNLEQKLLSIDLDQYLSNTHEFVSELLQNQEFQNKCQNLLESIFSNNNKEKFITNLSNLDNQSILLVTEKDKETANYPKKKTLISFKCQKHDEEMRMYDENEATLKEDRIICEECSIETKGPLRTILSIYKDWEKSKNTYVQSIIETQQQQSSKLKNTIQLYKDYQNELAHGINEIISTLEKEDHQQQNQSEAKISKLEQDWYKLSREQLIKIINNLTQPILRDNQIKKRTQKLEQKKNQLHLLLKNKLTSFIEIVQRNLKNVIQSINYDYNQLQAIFQGESNVIEQESQTTFQETNSIQCQTVGVRFSNIQYINELIMKLLNIEQQLKQQQGNEAFVQDQFNKIYSLFKLIKQDKIQFREFCNKIFLLIKTEFPKQDTQITNEKENKNKYLKKILKGPQDQQEFLQPQELFHQELQTSLVTCIYNDLKNYPYLQNFEKSIEQRIVSFTSKKQTLQFNKFYQWKITIKWITLQDFENYIEKDMLAELYAYCYGNYEEKLEYFLSSFTFLGFEIVRANVSQLKDTLYKWFKQKYKKINIYLE